MSMPKKLANLDTYNYFVREDDDFEKDRRLFKAYPRIYKPTWDKSAQDKAWRKSETDHRAERAWSVHEWMARRKRFYDELTEAEDAAENAHDKACDQALQAWKDLYRPIGFKALMDGFAAWRIVGLPFWLDSYSAILAKAVSPTDLYCVGHRRYGGKSVPQRNLDPPPFCGGWGALPDVQLDLGFAYSADECKPFLDAVSGAAPARVWLPLWKRREGGRFKSSVFYTVLIFDQWLWALSDAETLLESEDHRYVLLEAIDKERRRLERLKTKFTGSEDADQLGSREPIPEHVRIFVWRRDQGRCVKCGSQERLEYDHIIPVSKGGSSTERNIQLLCESCNRSKGARL